MERWRETLWSGAFAVVSTGRTGQGWEQAEVCLVSLSPVGSAVLAAPTCLVPVGQDRGWCESLRGEVLVVWALDGLVFM